MHVELVSLTPEAEAKIVYWARLSSEQRNDDTDARLVRYLIRQHHWSPFELAHATFEVKTSRAIAHQIVRHTSLRLQEFSQRYATVEDEPERTQARKQAAKNRQSSVDGLDQETKDWFWRVQGDIWEVAYRAYKNALALGVSREQARMLLPEMAPTKLYVTGSLRSWIHYLDLRCSEDTQWEHRIIALRIRLLLGDELPLIAEACDWPDFFPELGKLMQEPSVLEKANAANERQHHV